jgi:hypothetical protein
MREASVVAVLTAVLTSCGGRTELSVRDTADAAVGSGGATAFMGAGGTHAASGGSSEGGAPLCVPRDLGKQLGIPVVEGVLAGALAYSTCGTGPETWFHWAAPSAGSWAFDALGSDGNVNVTVLEGARACAAVPAARCGPGGVVTAVGLDQGESVTIVVNTSARTSGYLLSISGPIGGGARCPSLDVGATLGTVRLGRLGQDATFHTTFGCGGDPSFAVATSWTAPSSGYFDFDTAGSSFDTLLEVRVACGGGDHIYGCSDDYRGTDAHLGLFFEEGARVNVVLGGKAVIKPEEARYALSIMRQ